MSRSSNNFFRMEMLLLKIIEIGNGEYYGYKIVQQLQELSDDKIKLAEGVMYPILYRLLDKGYIIDEKRLVGKRKTRVYYKLEPKGKEYLNQLYIDYMDINTSIIKIMEAEICLKYGEPKNVMISYIENCDNEYILKRTSIKSIVKKIFIPYFVF